MTQQARGHTVDYFNPRTGHLRARYEGTSVTILLPYQSALEFQRWLRMKMGAAPGTLVALIASGVVGALLGLPFSRRAMIVAAGSLMLLMAIVLFLGWFSRARMIVTASPFGLGVKREKAMGRPMARNWIRHEVVDVYTSPSESKRGPRQVWIRVRLADESTQTLLDARSNAAAKWIVDAVRQAMRLDQM